MTGNPGQTLILSEYERINDIFFFKCRSVTLIFILSHSASEPNLKGRNMLKHRIRYKPLIENPLMPPTQAHPRHISPGTESRYSGITSGTIYSRMDQVKYVEDSL